jgi:hypothetical protein
MNTDNAWTAAAAFGLFAFCALGLSCEIHGENKRLRRENAETRPAREAYQIGWLHGFREGCELTATLGGVKNDEPEELPPPPPGYKRLRKGELEWIGKDADR